MIGPKAERLPLSKDGHWISGFFLGRFYERDAPGFVLRRTSIMRYIYFHFHIIKKDGQRFEAARHSDDWNWTNRHKVQCPMKLRPRNYMSGIENGRQNWIQF
jgi:hypothetical protein